MNCIATLPLVNIRYLVLVASAVNLECISSNSSSMFSCSFVEWDTCRCSYAARNEYHVPMLPSRYSLTSMWAWHGLQSRISVSNRIDDDAIVSCTVPVGPTHVPLSCGVPYPLFLKRRYIGGYIKGTLEGTSGTNNERIGGYNGTKRMQRRVHKGTLRSNAEQGTDELN